MGKASLLLSFLACLVSCRGTKQSAGLKDEVRSENFLAHCEKTDPRSEAGATYKALIEIVGVQNCSDAAPKLREITFLVLNEKNLKDLTPLEDLGQVQWLHLYGNRIEDITPLRRLYKLRDLVLDNNQIRDLSPLRDLIALQELSASRNRITNIEALSALKKLYILNLAGNQIADVRPLSGLSALMVLDLTNNPIAVNRNRTNCPTADGISQVLHDFCSL